jgi:hypothetical protein
MIQGQPGQIVCETSSPKITRAKWTRGVVQVVECLLCKWEALSSNCSSINKAKQQNKPTFETMNQNKPFFL